MLQVTVSTTVTVEQSGEQEVVTTTSTTTTLTGTFTSLQACATDNWFDSYDGASVGGFTAGNYIVTNNIDYSIDNAYDCCASAMSPGEDSNGDAEAVGAANWLFGYDQYGNLNCALAYDNQGQCANGQASVTFGVMNATGASSLTGGNGLCGTFD